METMLPVEEVQSYSVPLSFSPDLPAHRVLAMLGASLCRRDPGTHGHAVRVIAYTRALTAVLGLSETETAIIEHGVFLHDIGKIPISDDILLKPYQLTRAEWAIMRQHPITGFHMVGLFPFLGEAAAIVLAHHEWFDGRGYPYGLSREEIPLGARVCAVVDTLDALTSIRPYRRPVSFDLACDYIRAQRGTHFDPVVVDAFVAIPPWEWAALRTAPLRAGVLTA